MPVSVMHVGVVRVLVRHRFMPVRMRMPRPWRHRRIVGMAVVLVMLMLVGVLCRFVPMRMQMLLG